MASNTDSIFKLVTDLSKEVAGFITTRFKNRLVLAFAVSWIVVNWRAILVLIYIDKPVVERINYLDDNYLNYVDGLVYPLFLSLFYYIAIPHLKNLFDKVLKKSNEIRISNYYESLRQAKEKEEEIAEIEFRTQQARDGSKKINENLEEIQRLNKQIDEGKEREVKLQESIDAVSKKFIEISEERTELFTSQSKLETELSLKDKKLEKYQIESNENAEYLAKGVGLIEPHAYETFIRMALENIDELDSKFYTFVVEVGIDKDYSEPAVESLKNSRVIDIKTRTIIREGMKLGVQFTPFGRSLGKTLQYFKIIDKLPF